MLLSEILAFLSHVLFQGILRPRIRAFSTDFRSAPTPTASSSAFAQSMANFDADSVTYLKQRDAAEIDETLMGPLGFSVDQLMVISFFTSFSIFLTFHLLTLSHCLCYLTPFIPNGRSWLVWVSPLPFLRYLLCVYSSRFCEKTIIIVKFETF